MYRLISLLVLTALCAITFASQSARTSDARVELRPVQSLELHNEGLLVGIAKLNGIITDVGFSIETIPGTETEAPPQDPIFRAHLEKKTLAETLDWLCRLDARYAWARDGTAINVFPRATMKDQSYFFNRLIDHVSVTQATKPLAVVGMIARSVTSSNDHLISWDTERDFSQPWNVDFDKITVREALNETAQQISKNYGWLVTGNRRVMLFSFHQRLVSDSKK